MIITNKLNLPESMVNAVDPNPHNKEGCLSATTLLRGVKDIVLTKRHWNNITVDASDRVFAMFGTAVHYMFEQADDKECIQKEMEVSHKVGSYNITGKIDRYDPGLEMIFDYKTTSVFKIMAGDYEEWNKQLMIYAWLLNKNNIHIHKAEIIAILKDWSEIEYKKKKNEGYPETKVVQIDFNVTPEALNDIEQFIKSKVEEIEQTNDISDDDIPPCSSKERWEKPTVWKIMKDGAARSLKNFNLKEEAYDYFNNLKSQSGIKVVEVKGCSPKCMNYCDCKNYCNFYKMNVMEEA